MSFLVAVTLAVLIRSASAAAAGPETGSITGQIQNAATGSYLQGAVVAVDGTTRTAITDREGRYRLSGLSSGAAILVVSFSGLDPQRIPIGIGSDGPAVRDVALTSEIYKLDKFIVAGDREGTARSEALRRQAPNVVNIISADTFGNRADANIANLLENVAGISAIYNDLEARQISIRGIDGNLNSVSMDGQQMASSAGNTARNFLFDQMGVGNVESIEVTKAATPDMEGASVGGGINLVTKSAFDRSGGRQITYSAGLTTQPTFHAYSPKWKEPIAGYGPFFNFQYLDVLGAKRNVGIAVTAAWTNFQLTHTKSAFSYGFNNPNPVPTPITNYTRRPWSVNRTKFLTGVKLDYRWSESTTVSAGLTYNYSHILNSNPGAILSNPATFATVDASGNRTGGGQVAPNSTGEFTRVFPAANTTMTLNDFRQPLYAQTLVFQPLVRHRLDRLNITYGLSYSDSLNNRDQPSRISGNTFATLSNIGWTIDRSKDATWPAVTQTAGPDMYNLNNYTTLRLDDTANDFKSRIFNAKLDVKKDFAFPLPTYVKTGLSFQEESRKLRQVFRRWFYTGPDGVLGNADDNRDLAQFRDTIDPRNSDSDFRKYQTDLGGAIPYPNSYAVARHIEQNPRLWSEDLPFGLQSSLLSRRQLVERISAAYILGHLRFGRASVLGGMRVEETRDEGEGPLTYISPEERARRAAWAGTVTPEENLRRVNAQYGGRQSNKGLYRNVLPSVHLRYEPIARLVTRASWATGIGRPAFGTIIPSDTVVDETARVTRNNPNLKPQFVHSYDLVADYYFKSQGSISAGAFRKNIGDYIYTETSIIGSGRDNGFQGEYAGYTLTTQANRGTATVEGLEFSYQQQLTFLPGWSKGFGVHATFTKLKTEGNYGGTTNVTSSSLAGFVPESGSLGLSYRGYGFELRLQAVAYGGHVLAANANPVLVQYRRSRMIWNWKSKYNFSRKLSVFLDVDNFTSAPSVETYIGFKERQNNWYTFDPRIQVGIGGQF
ncbi:MAG: TonB-dependent receptor [Verrucomicrobia bacterium]|nr:TonB-dependent receptor [Verrucomicrobiota bacterium]